MTIALGEKVPHWPDNLVATEAMSASQWSGRRISRSSPRGRKAGKWEMSLRYSQGSTRLTLQLATSDRSAAARSRLACCRRDASSLMGFLQGPPAAIVSPLNAEIVGWAL